MIPITFERFWSISIQLYGRESLGAIVNKYMGHSIEDYSRNLHAYILFLLYYS